jgi:DNA-binding NtrC family response regulator
MRILIVDDGWKSREGADYFDKWVEDNDFSCRITEDGGKTMQHVRSGNADIILLNVEPEKKNYDGRKLYRKIKNFENSISIIILIPDKDGDPSYFRLGAEGSFFLKSLDMDILISTIKNVSYRDRSQPYLEGISDNARKIRNQVFSYGKFGGKSSVMLSGPVFTGHEFIADLIQKSSSRAKKTYIKIDCSGLDERQIRILLFGYMEPKSVDKNEEKYINGVLANANGGTLFIDNIEKLPESVQEKLYRSVQSGKFIPENGKIENTKAFNVRIISAYTDSKDSRLVPQLRHVLSELLIELPSLRERISELEEFIKFYISKHSLINERITGIEERALLFLKNYELTGNFKELENIVVRAMTISNADQEGTAELKERYLLNL